MAGRLFELQSRNGILEEKDRRLYEYAYGVLLGRVVIYLIIVILGIITGNWMEMIVFLLPFTVLRQYAGGIHLEKAGGCMAVSGILVLLCSLYLASDGAGGNPQFFSGIVHKGFDRIKWTFCPFDFLAFSVAAMLGFWVEGFINLFAP